MPIFAMELPETKQTIKKIGKAKVVQANFPVALSPGTGAALYNSGSACSFAPYYIGMASESIGVPARDVPRAVMAPDASWFLIYPVYEQDRSKIAVCGYLFHRDDGFKKSIRCALPTSVSSQSIVACALGVNHLVVRSRLLIQIASIENLIHHKIVSKDPFDLVCSSVKKGYPKITSDREKDFFLQSLNDTTLVVVAGSGNVLEMLTKECDETWCTSAQQVFDSTIAFMQINAGRGLIGISLVGSPSGISLYTDTLEEYARTILVGFSPKNSFSFSPCGDFVVAVGGDEKTINVYNISNPFLSSRKGGYECSERIKDAQLAWTFQGIFFGTRYNGYLILGAP